MSIFRKQQPHSESFLGNMTASSQHHFYYALLSLCREHYGKIHYLIMVLMKQKTILSLKDFLPYLHHYWLTVVLVQQHCLCVWLVHLVQEVSPIHASADIGCMQKNSVESQWGKIQHNPKPVVNNYLTLILFYYILSIEINLKKCCPWCGLFLCLNSDASSCLAIL